MNASNLEIRVKLLESSALLDSLVLREVCAALPRASSATVAQRIVQTLGRVEDLLGDAHTAELDALFSARLNEYLRALGHGGA